MKWRVPRGATLAATVLSFGVTVIISFVQWAGYQRNRPIRELSVNEVLGRFPVLWALVFAAFLVYFIFISRNDPS